MSRLIWIYAVCKNLLLSRVEAKEFRRSDALSGEVTLSALYNKGEQILSVWSRPFLEGACFAGKRKTKLQKVAFMVKTDGTSTRCIQST